MIFALQDEPEKGRRIAVLLIGVCAAAAVWGGGLFAASQIPAPERPKQVAIQVKIFEKPAPPKEEAPPTEAPPPPPVTEPPPPPATEPPPPPKVKPPKVKPPKVEPPKVEPPPPAKPEAPVTAAKPVPVQLGMTMDSTDARGAGPAIQVGNQFGGNDRGAAKGPETGKPTPEEVAPVPAREPVRTGATVLKKVSGEYTRAALRAGIEGKVIVVVTIGPDGTVKGAQLIKGLGYGLDEVALEAAKKWTFKAATLDGKPIESTKRITVDFVIED